MVHVRVPASVASSICWCYQNLLLSLLLEFSVHMNLQKWPDWHQSLLYLPKQFLGNDLLHTVSGRRLNVNPFHSNGEFACYFQLSC